jgi:signal transduction histidine kinase
MLDAIIADLKTPQSNAERADKGRGRSDAPPAKGGGRTAAQSHGAGRARSGFDVQQMVSEYRALRASVLDLWLDRSGGMHSDETDDLMRFNEAIDQALAESAASYSRVIEHELRDAQDQLEARVDQRTQDLARANESLRSEMDERKRSEAVRVRLLQKLVEAQEDERRRISRELHDQLGQQLTALGVKLRGVKTLTAGNAESQAEINSMEAIARQMNTDVDFLVWELRPTTLDDLGLVDALSDYAASWSKHVGVQAQIDASRMRRERLMPEVETVLYRISQEALNNVAKHATARNVDILLEQRSDSVSLIIEDDGIGFDPQKAVIDARGLGLVGMRERAAFAGGTLTIESNAAEGTTLFIRIPLSGSAKSEDG